MSKINPDFDIPYYIFEELVKYTNFKYRGIEKEYKLKDINILLNIAVGNNKLSTEQADFLKKTFCN